jgi:hypothetical protein
MPHETKHVGTNESGVGSRAERSEGVHDRRTRARPHSPRRDGEWHGPASARVYSLEVGFTQNGVRERLLALPIERHAQESGVRGERPPSGDENGDGLRLVTFESWGSCTGLGLHFRIDRSAASGE